MLGSEDEADFKCYSAVSQAALAKCEKTKSDELKAKATHTPEELESIDIKYEQCVE